ncbi:MAG: ABC transporter ATP-binding protein [Eubacteriales bacterium]|jgi:ATP-binding cassette subfamily B protein
MKEKNKNALSDFIHILPHVLKIAPIGFVLLAVFSVLHSGLWFFVMRFNQRFYDSLISFAENDAVLFDVITALLLVATTQILKHVFNGISNFIPIVIKSKVNQSLSFAFHEKIGSIDAVMFEKPDFLESIEKANRGKSEIAWNTITLFYIIFFYIPYFIFVSSYLFSLKPILVITIIIIFVPIVLTQFVKAKIYAQTEDMATPIKRENSYYLNCIVDREYFKETRILGSVGYFLKLFKKTLKEINNLQLKADKKASIINLCLQLFSLAGYLGVLLLLFNSVISGSISIGAFSAVFQGINDVYKLMEEVIYSSVGGMSRDLGYIKNYTDFMTQEGKKQASHEIDECGDITVQDVSFKYPGADDYALKNINLHIKKNEVVAVVGENGSGKTTLMRLLSGIYTPELGQINYGGTQVADITPKSLYGNMSAVFQNFQKYKMNLGENIRISDLSNPALSEVLDNVCKNTRINPNNQKIYPDGYDTMLSREFNGVELSGGQWQRIAIARGLYKRCSIIFLDEPTAAIDPIEEVKIYNDFITLIQGNTAFIVTHRLGSVRLADRIIVLDNGKIVGDGSHNQLMKNCCQYKRLFNEQKKWYV